MDRYNQLFQEIFKQPLSHEANVGLLEKTIADYPYFTPANFFLLHFTEKSSPAFANQARKTALQFNNNYWLNFQLLEIKVRESQQYAEGKVTANAESFSTVVDHGQVTKNTFEPDAKEADKQTISAGEKVQVKEDEFLPEAQVEKQTTEESISGGEMIQQSFSADILAEIAPVTEPISYPEAFTQQLTETPVRNEQEYVIHTTETQKDENEFAQAPQLLIDEVQANNAPATTTSTFEAEALPAYTEAEIAENEAAYNETDLVPDSGEDAGMDHVSLKMAETLAGINLDKNTTEDTISFEPLHASDYFASVGIRLSDEVKPADKLGMQLKSFTEWLKTMKKVHAEQLADTSTSNDIREKTDKTIQELAEASNKENEILTEAMADVFQQQGKTGKAIEVYEKLSLLDPSKKVYFAAKIKQLKD